MKKETVNLFNKGLNYDLNPLTTPNDVLTDCVNGTFVTFNGDELILQNDAGNTKILIPNTGEYVKLSEGFHPIGVKEYGGILYIVSSNGDEIEFGSYPSPDILDKYDDGISGGLVISKSDNDDFYIEKFINDELFVAGRYIKFNTDNILNDLTNFSTYTLVEGVLTKQPKLYDLKLIQKLDNGYIDLTENIWKKYLNSSGSNHWFNNSTFKYFCPNNFKGKLAVRFEVVPMTTFERVKVSIDSDRKFRTEVRAVKGGNWEIANVMVEINGNTSSTVGSLAPTSPETIWKGGSDGTGITIPEGVQIVNYKIYPEFYITGSSSTQYALTEFPIKFQNMYTITGSIAVVNSVDDIKVHFKSIATEISCEDDGGTPTGFSIYSKIPITNLNGISINPITLEVESPLYYLYNIVEYPDAATNVGYAGHYSINSTTNSLDSVTFKKGIKYTDTLRRQLSETKLRWNNPACLSETIATFDSIVDLTGTPLSVNFEQGITNETKLLIDTAIEFNVINNEQFIVSLSDFPSWSEHTGTISIIYWGITSSQNYFIAPALKLYIETEEAGGIVTDYLKWDKSVGALTISADILYNGSILLGTKTITGYTRIPLRDSNEANWGVSRVYSITISGGTAVGSTDFVNITDTGLYQKFGTPTEVVLRTTQFLSNNDSQ